MNSSTGFIITGIIVGLSLVVGGSLYLSNKSTVQPSMPMPVQKTPFGQDDGRFYSGGNRTKRKHNKRRKTYKK